MDPYVHSTTTEAIGSTTGKDLLQAGHEFTPQTFSESPVPADTPEGSITGVTKKWWNDQRSKVNCHPSYDMYYP